MGADTGDDEVEVLAVSTQNPGYVLGASASWVRGDLYVIAGLGKGKVTPAPTSFGAPRPRTDWMLRLTSVLTAPATCC